MLTDLALLLTLILLNGLFAMSEMAIVSARRTRLMQLAEAGRAGASHALALSAQPTRFLSTVQVGITSIGILSGAIGEATVAYRLREMFARVPVLAPYAETLSLVVMVAGLTYVSLILGELVPKRLALTRPELIASLVARPMETLARITRPIVYLLSASTDAILRLIGAPRVSEPTASMEELKVLLETGAEEGVFERHEQQMVTNVLNLDDRYVDSVLTPRSEIVYLDLREPEERNRQKLREDPHSVMPLCDGGLDHVVGFVRSVRVLEQLLDGKPLDLKALAEPPLFVPERMTLMQLLEEFKRMHLPVALVVDEFGDVEGLVSLSDVISAIVGEMPPHPLDEPLIVQREDGSWLLDGGLDLETVFRTIGSEWLLEEADRQHVRTLGGFVMLELGRVPRVGEVFERGGFRFEVVDMDRNRVDRVLVSRIETGPTLTSAAPAATP